MEHINVVLFINSYLRVTTAILKDTNGQWWIKYVFWSTGKLLKQCDVSISQTSVKIMLSFLFVFSVFYCGPFTVQHRYAYIYIYSIIYSPPK